MSRIFDQSDRDKHRFWNTAPVNPLAEAKKRGLDYGRPGRALMPESPFPLFGPHLSKTMRQVPAEFLRWVEAQPWAASWPKWAPVRDYLQRFPLPEASTVNAEAEKSVRAPVIYVSTVEVHPGARGVFKHGAARLYVMHEDLRAHLLAFAGGALNLWPDWLRGADATAPPHFLLTPERQEQALGAGADLVTRREMDRHAWLWSRTHSAGGQKLVREMPDGTTRCTKHCYADKKEAETVINQRTQGRANLRRNRPVFLRAYPCPECGFWHLTSRPLRGNDEC